VDTSGEQGEAPPGRAANLLGAVALLAADATAHAHEDVLGTARGQGSVSAVLIALTTFGSLTVDQIGALLGISHSGASRIATRLGELGWTARAAGPDGPDADGRVVTVTLTASGEATVQRLLASRGTALQGLLAPLTPVERDSLAGLLAKLIRHSVAGRAALHRRCRQCDHSVCLPCPALEGLQGEA